MVFGEVNVIPIIAAAVVSFIIGMLWYSQALFGKRWMKASGVTPAKQKAAKKEMPKMMIMALILGLIMAFALDQLITATGISTTMAGAQLGFLIWLGFIATTQAMGMMWGTKSKDLYWIDTGHYLVSLLVIGALLASWSTYIPY